MPTAHRHQVRRQRVAGAALFGPALGTGKNGRHRLTGLLPQSVFGRLAGYENVNDADRLCRDPAMRWVVGDQAITRSAASASQMGWLYFRGDAAFADSEIYEFLEAEGIGHTIRLPANRVVQDKIDTCSSAQSGDRRTTCAATSPASAIPRKAGRS